MGTVWDGTQSHLNGAGCFKGANAVSFGHGLIFHKCGFHGLINVHSHLVGHDSEFIVVNSRELHGFILVDDGSWRPWELIILKSQIPVAADGFSMLKHDKHVSW